jgi:hypothetical protein
MRFQRILIGLLIIRSQRPLSMVKLKGGLNSNI